MVGGGRWGARCEVHRGLRRCRKSSRSREVASCGSCGKLWEVVGVAGDAEGGAERGCEVPDGLAASAGVAHKAPGWHQVNSK